MEFVRKKGKKEGRGGGEIKIQRENIYTRSGKSINVGVPRIIGALCHTVIPLCSLTFRNVDALKTFRFVKSQEQRSIRTRDNPTVLHPFNIHPRCCWQPAANHPMECWARGEGKMQILSGVLEGGRGERYTIRARAEVTFDICFGLNGRNQRPTRNPASGAFILAREDTGRAAINTLSI